MTSNIKTEFYAKSREPDGKQETVYEHCKKVSQKAAEYGAPLGIAEEARVTGLYHDFGKFSRSFQGVLKGTHSGIDHAFSSAAIYDFLNKHKPQSVVEAINGHHDGLKKYADIKDDLKASVMFNRPIYCNAYKESALSGAEEYKQAIDEIMSRYQIASELKFKPVSKSEYAEDNIINMLDTRLLFSCLVDADYTVSGNREEPPCAFDAQGWLEALNAHCRKLREGSDSDPQLNRLRNLLFECCGNVGARARAGLYTLTAPTGTGKTLALLNFALQYCLNHQDTRRIILVLPFLALTEQSANAYSNIIPDILQDHSQSNLDEAAAEHAAKWDAPFIITTSVKFFEALFAHKPTDCRKLHNIANSVIIFDEAQTLPSHLTASTLQAIDRLCTRYNCTMVLSTATQPDYSALQLPHWEPKEIMPDHAEMFRQTQRTRVIWKLDKPTPFEEIASEMVQADNVCTIVNLRSHARILYKLLREQCEEESTFYLTTDLCPAHRTALISLIKERQKAGLPCRVVSTQCIEAGVDLDFSAMYRALAPLEAIIQAAGRCNRNGRMNGLGTVTVFIPVAEGSLYPGEWYELCAGLVKNLLHAHNGHIELNDPSAIREYYNQIFEHQHDKPSLTNAIEARNYEETDKTYKLIDNGGFKVLVPFGDRLELYSELRQEALESGITGKWLRRAAPLIVTIWERLDKPELAFPVEQLYYPRKRGIPRVPSDVWVLNTGSEGKYLPDMGLQLNQINADDLLY